MMLCYLADAGPHFQDIKEIREAFPTRIIYLLNVFDGKSSESKNDGHSGDVVKHCFIRRTLLIQSSEKRGTVSTGEDHKWTNIKPTQ